MVPEALRDAAPETVRDEVASIPFRRIARYALYALAVVAVGWLVSGAVATVLDLALLPLHLLFDGPIGGTLHDGVLSSLTGAIELFAALFAAGVFLTQFERAG